MAATLLLDRQAWDLVLDVEGDIAVATEPYSLAQDAASAIKLFVGESFWDTEAGVPYMTQILGKRIPLALLKQFFIEAALTVPDIVSAQFFVSMFSDRILSGQIQVVSLSGETSLAPVTFVASNPQGLG